MELVMMGNGKMRKRMDMVIYAIIAIGIFYFANGNRYDGVWSGNTINRDGKLY